MNLSNIFDTKKLEVIIVIIDISIIKPHDIIPLIFAFKAFRLGHSNSFLRIEVHLPNSLKIHL